jgi:alkaline phosphatase
MNNHSLPRRAFLRGSTLILAGSALSGADLLADEAAARPRLKIGLLTDLHYADKPPAGSRHYRETPGKLDRAIKQFTGDQVDFTVELGDLVDAATSVEDEKGYLKTTCFRSDNEPYGRNNFTWTDANIPASQLEWLAADLKQAEGKTIVFAHQRVDETKQHSVKNANAVRKVLEMSGKVAAVFQGHSHQNDYQQIAGIHYCTVAAMVEGSGEKNNAFARLDLLSSGALRVEGFVRQKAYAWN